MLMVIGCGSAGRIQTAEQSTVIVTSNQPVRPTQPTVATTTVLGQWEMAPKYRPFAPVRLAR
jgi:hypothetical protein